MCVNNYFETEESKNCLAILGVDKAFKKEFFFHLMNTLLIGFVQFETKQWFLSYVRVISRPILCLVSLVLL